VSPMNGATNVAANVPVQIRLSEPIAPPTVGQSAIQLAPATAGTVTLSADHQTITFTPSGSLVNGPYTVSATGFQDLSGNFVTPFVSTFTVGAPADSSHGTIFIAPANGAGNVPTNAHVVLTFNK